MTYLLLVIGLGLLVLGGDWLVKGASDIATRFGVPQMIVGLTIVGFGTSSPELLVSLQAAWANQPAIAIGNVIGSNIANILLIGGITAAITPMLAPYLVMRRDVTVMLCATLALPVVFWSGTIGPVEGGVLLAGLAIFLGASLSAISSEPAPMTPVTSPVWTSLARIAVGLAGLMIGASLLVDNASSLARIFGVSEAMIGLSIVAVGTSLPELATSVTAALRGNREIAIGNIIGSNIFNILFILGTTALIAPIPVATRFINFDAPIVIGVTLLLAGLIWKNGQIGRITGLLMVTAYALYIGVGAEYSK